MKWKLQYIGIIQGLYWASIGIMENRMETTIYRDYIGIILDRGYIVVP